MQSVLINTNLLIASKEEGIKKYFFSSSACAYNTKKQLGSSGNKDEELINDYSSLLNLLKSHNPSPIFNNSIPEIICEVKLLMVELI